MQTRSLQIIAPKTEYHMVACYSRPKATFSQVFSLALHPVPCYYPTTSVTEILIEACAHQHIA